MVQAVDSPGGTQTVAAGAVGYAGTERVGRYTVREDISSPAAGTGAPGGASATGGTPLLADFRVSLLAPAESDLRPRAQASLTPSTPRPAAPAPALDLVPLLLVGLLALSTAEWWRWSRGA